MKGIRDGKAEENEMEGLSAFASLVEDMYAQKDPRAGV